MRAKLAPLLVLGVAAAAAWWLWSASADGPFVPPSAGTRTEAPVPASAPAPSVPASTSTRGAQDPGPTGRAEVARVGDAPAAAAPAVVRGRCVDPEGRALAGVKVELSGRAGNAQRLEEHLRDHGPVEWSNPPPIQTAPDGRFEFRFVPPPPYSFSLFVHGEGRVTRSARWQTIESGSTHELGDVVLHHGVRVHGRVVDTKGAPQEGVIVILSTEREDGARAGVAEPPGGAQAWSRADGTFSFPASLDPGPYRLSLGGAELRAPGNRVVLELPETRLEISVGSADDGTSLRGIVVDSEGNPVAGAFVTAVNVPGRSSVSTKRDGRFVLTADRPVPRGTETALEVEATGFEILRSERRFPWGDAGIRLALQRGLDVDVVVRRARDGAPVERFVLRMFPKPETVRRWSSLDYEPRGGPHHPHGVARVTGVRRGSHLLSVAPADVTLCRVDLVEAIVEDNRPRMIEVRLPDAAARAVHVRRSDGSAVEGARVELLQPIPGEMVMAATRALSIEQWWYWQAGSKALLVAEAVTDAHGTCALRGPSGAGLAVRVAGPTHRTLVQQPVRLDVAEPLVVTVSAGASLRGRVTPQEVVGDLLEQAGVARGGGTEEERRGRTPSILLLRTAGGAEEHFPPDADQLGAPLDAAGSFVLRGIPPGTWDVAVVTARALPGAGNLQRGPPAVVLPGVEFTDGATVEVQVSLGAWRRGRVRGRVLLDGAAFQGRVSLRAWTPPAEGPSETWVMATCDAAGGFEVLLPATRWRPVLQLTGAGARAEIPAEESVTVTAGAEVEAVFHAHSARQRLRILDPGGSPVAGLELGFLRGGVSQRPRCPPTGQDGRTEVFGAAGSYEVRSRRRALVDPTAWQTFEEECRRQGVTTDSGLVTLGTVVLPGGEDEIVLRLPPEWVR